MAGVRGPGFVPKMVVLSALLSAAALLGAEGTARHHGHRQRGGTAPAVEPAAAAAAASLDGTAPRFASVEQGVVAQGLFPSAATSKAGASSSKAGASMPAAGGSANALGVMGAGHVSANMPRIPTPPCCQICPERFIVGLQMLQLADEVERATYNHFKLWHELHSSTRATAPEAEAKPTDGGKAAPADPAVLAMLQERVAAHTSKAGDMGSMLGGAMGAVGAMGAMGAMGAGGGAMKPANFMCCPLCPLDFVPPTDSVTSFLQLADSTSAARAAAALRRTLVAADTARNAGLCSEASAAALRERLAAAAQQVPTATLQRAEQDVVAWCARDGAPAPAHSALDAFLQTGEQVQAFASTTASSSLRADATAAAAAGAAGRAAKAGGQLGGVLPGGVGGAAGGAGAGGPAQSRLDPSDVPMCCNVCPSQLYPPRDYSDVSFLQTASTAATHASAAHAKLGKAVAGALPGGAGTLGGLAGAAAPAGAPTGSYNGCCRLCASKLYGAGGDGAPPFGEPGNAAQNSGSVGGPLPTDPRPLGAQSRPRNPINFRDYSPSG